MTNNRFLKRRCGSCKHFSMNPDCVGCSINRVEVIDTSPACADYEKYIPPGHITFLDVAGAVFNLGLIAVIIILIWCCGRLADMQ